MCKNVKVQIAKKQRFKTTLKAAVKGITFYDGKGEVKNLAEWLQAIKNWNADDLDDGLDFLPAASNMPDPNVSFPDASSSTMSPNAASKRPRR